MAHLATGSLLAGSGCQRPEMPIDCATMARVADNHINVSDYEPMTETMRTEVLLGLSQDPKTLPSHYLYDERGARLFERICDTDEYYLTRTELGVLHRHLDAITSRIGPQALVIEPGSGSGVKTRLLLDGLKEPAGYVPIDVAFKDQERVRTEFSYKYTLAEFAALAEDARLSVEETWTDPNKLFSIQYLEKR